MSYVHINLDEATKCLYSNTTQTSWMQPSGAWAQRLKVVQQKNSPTILVSSSPPPPLFDISKANLKTLEGLAAAFESSLASSTYKIDKLETKIDKLETENVELKGEIVKLEAANVDLRTQVWDQREIMATNDEFAAVLCAREFVPAIVSYLLNLENNVESILPTYFDKHGNVAVSDLLQNWALTAVPKRQDRTRMENQLHVDFGLTIAFLDKWDAQFRRKGNKIVHNFPHFVCKQDKNEKFIFDNVMMSFDYKEIKPSEKRAISAKVRAKLGTITEMKEVISELRDAVRITKTTKTKRRRL